MSAQKFEPQFAVRVPGPQEDRPSWIKVGVIAAIGFGVGVFWPRIAGVKLGPSAPEAAHAQAATRGSAAPPSSTQAPAAAAISTATATAEPTAPATPPAAMPTVTYGHGYVTSCKTRDGEAHKGAACGAIGGFDSLAQPRLKRVAECQAAVGASGKLAVVFSVDFDANHVGVDLGRATTIASPESLLTCVRTAFKGVSVAGVDHQHPRYGILYTLAITPAAGSAAPEVAPQAAGGKAEGDEKPAQVAWETALVRDTPKTGKVLARLPRGTNVRVGQTKEGWYHVKFGTDLASEGWVYRGAIGK